MTQGSLDQLPMASSPHSLEHFLRIRLLGLAILSLLALLYASLVPFEFQPRTWNDALHQFAEIKWLNLDVYRRADWVANGLVAFPFSFFFAGQWIAEFSFPFVFHLGDRDHHRRYWCDFRIEFLQIWFPLGLSRERYRSRKYRGYRRTRFMVFCVDVSLISLASKYFR